MRSGGEDGWREVAGGETAAERVRGVAEREGEEETVEAEGAL